MLRPELVSVDDAAAFFRRTRRTVELWMAEGMPHKRRSGRTMIDLGIAVDWRVEQARADARAETAPKEADERARKLKAEADLKELEVAERRGQLLPAGEYQARLDEFVGGFAAVAAGQLQRFERDIVRAGDAPAARLLTQRIHAALMAGAQDYAERLEAEAEALEVAEPAA